MNESNDRNPVEELAEDFLERYRRGERPALSQYTRQHPDLAEEIRELFPALVMLEGVRPLSITDTPNHPIFSASAARPERLGDYRILREVGRGGMGIVYEAEQESLGRHVALKVLPSQALIEPQHLQRFQREARSAARLHHTNIVPVFGVGEADGLHYYVMQFIHGQGLDQILLEMRRLRTRTRDRAESLPAQSEGGAVAAAARSLLTGVFRTPLHEDEATDGRTVSNHPPPAPDVTPAASAPSALPGSFASTSGAGRLYWQSVARVGIQAADALAYAHSQGTLHRDIKPANLLLDTQGIVWITDFGLAKAQDSEALTHTGDVVGTLRYMAPERFDGKGDARSDVYSLGLTLYEMLTLRPAFDEYDRSKLIRRVINADAARPRKLNPAVPRDLETIVLKAIAADPAHRYPGAAELRDDLARFRDDKPIMARRVGELERVWRWGRRNPIPALLTAAFLLTLLLGIVGVTWKWLDAEKGRQDADDERHKTKIAERLTAQQRDEAVTARNDARILLAGMMLDRGTTAAEQGDIGDGLFWMLEALKAAPEQSASLRYAIRTNLSAWLTQVSSLQQVIDDFDSAVVKSTFHPDGIHFLTADFRGNIASSNLMTGQRKQLAAIANPTACEFSPNAAMIVTASFGDKEKRNTIMQRWDAISGKPIGDARPCPSVVRCIAFTPDGKQFATGSDDGTIRLWDAETLAMVREGYQHEAAVVGGLAISPDGKTIASATHDAQAGDDPPGAGHLWDLASGKRLGSPMRHKAGVNRIVFSPDGKRVVTASWDTTAQIWDAATGTPIGSPLKHRRPVHAARYSPDGLTLATGSEEGIDFWSGVTGEELAGKPNLGRSSIDDLAWSRDGRLLSAAGRFDDQHGIACILRHAHAITRPLATAAEWKRKFAWSKEFTIPWFREHVGTLHPDATRAITGGNHGIAQIRDTATSSPAAGVAGVLRHSAEGVTVTAASSDGRLFATACRDDMITGEARLWNAQTGMAVGPPLRHVNHIAALAFSPDGKILASGGYDRAVQLWSTADGSRLGDYLPQRDIVLSLVFSPDSKTLAVGHAADYSGATGIVLWDLATRKPLGPSMKGPNLSPLWRSDSQRLLARIGAQLLLWDPARPEAPELAVVESANITCMTFGPRDATLLVGLSDGTVRLRDAATLKPVGASMYADVPTTVVTFSPDPEARLILAGYADGSARLWDRASQKPIGPPMLHGRWITTAAFMPGGDAFCTVSDDGAARRWPVPSPIADDAVLLQRIIETATGRVMTDGQIITSLSPSQWRERRDRLARHGGLAAFQAVNELAYHDARARDAEDENAPWAARWHLDRLIAMDNARTWLPWARRARLATSSRDFASAVADCIEAEKRGSADELQAWYRHQVADGLEHSHWQAAAWYIERARSGMDWGLYSDRAAVMAHLERYPEFEADLARAVEQGAETGCLVMLANDLAKQGKFAQAARAFGAGAARGAMPAPARFRHALLCLINGDVATYRKRCAAAMAENNSTANPAVANSTAWLCVFAPRAVDDLEAPIRLAEMAQRDADPQFRSAILNTLGCALYRAGRHKEAIQKINEGVALRGRPEAHDLLYLAMAHYRLGEIDRAQEYYAKVTPTTAKTHGVWIHLETEVVRREAEMILKGRPITEH